MREAETRLTTLTTQFAPSLATGFATRVHALQQLASDPALAAQLDAGAGRTLPGADSVLVRLARDTAGVVNTVLRDASGRTVLSVGKHAPRDSMSDGSLQPGHALDTASVGRLTLRDGFVSYELRTNIVRDGQVIGQLVQRRAAEANGAAVARQLKTIGQLIGSDGALLLGNTDGSVWTDLRRTVHRPPPSHGLEQYSRGGIPKLAVAETIPGSPMALAFEFDAAHVTGPLQSMLGGFAAVAAAIVLIGALLGWWQSRGVTVPLARLTAAAEAISSGDLDHPPAAGERADEIGRLSRAFATMTGNVRAARDTLEQQVAERTAQLRAAQEENVRQERLATLGQLSSSVGHELRNPLGVMSNAVYFLNATLQSPHPKTTEYLGILQSQIALSEKIVSDLLDFARVRPPQQQDMTVGEIVDDQLARTSIPSGVRVERGGDASARVRVDPVQIGQVVLNLLTNAAQAMEETGGTLRVDTAGENGTVHLRVRDTGPGIAEEHLSKVFEPLFTTKARGIGLGLSVSRSLAEANGGTLTVTSKPGAGATFVLDLPAAP